MDELIKQVPAIIAIVIIVFYFLQSNRLMQDAYLRAQADRDRLFLDSIHALGAIVSGLSNELGENTRILVDHDSTMRVAARMEKSKVRKNVK